MKALRRRPSPSPCLLCAGGARAHVVYGTETLRGLVQQSDLVARVRILSPGTALPLEEPVVVAEILELIKGPAAAAPGPLRFVQHGHGVPLYQKDQEVALFLQRIGRSRELGSLAGTVDWISIQEGDALAGDAAPRRRAARVCRAREAAARAAAGRDAGDHREAARVARREARVLGGARPGPRRRARRSSRRRICPALEKVLWNDATPIGVRVALLAELERRKLVPGPPQWVRLLRETRGADQIAVVRAAAAHPSAAVTQELVALLASDDVLLVSAAAISLGVPGNEKAVGPLGKLLGSSERARAHGRDPRPRPDRHALRAGRASRRPPPATPTPPPAAARAPRSPAGRERASSYALVFAANRTNTCFIAATRARYARAS